MFCGDRHWPVSMLSPSPQDCAGLVATLRSRHGGDVYIKFAWSAQLRYCYGCTEGDVNWAVADPRYNMYVTYAPPFWSGDPPAGAGGAAPVAQCHDLPLAREQHETSALRAVAEGASSTALRRAAAVAAALAEKEAVSADGASDSPWSSPSGLGCADYEHLGWCRDGRALRMDGPVHNSPEHHCCACGGGQQQEGARPKPASDEVEHIGCVKSTTQLSLRLRSARVDSMSVVNLGELGGSRRHRSREAVAACSERCAAFSYFAVAGSGKHEGHECVCYTIDSTVQPLTRWCDERSGRGDSQEVHVYAQPAQSSKVRAALPRSAAAAPRPRRAGRVGLPAAVLAGAAALGAIAVAGARALRWRAANAIAPPVSEGGTPDGQARTRGAARSAAALPATLQGQQEPAPPPGAARAVVDATATMRQLL